jgi:DNA-directed RNA polymerase subunit F
MASGSWMPATIRIRPKQRPLYEQFQKEQQVIDCQLDATKYADSFAKLGDAEALAYVNALLERDQKMHDLRVKWLAKFQTVVPAKTAARAIQLERRLGLVTQVGISSGNRHCSR